MKNKRFLIFLVILIILAGFWFSWQIYQRKGEALINTDKGEYRKEETLKLAIKNNFRKNICFSSCYPYYLEKKNGEWKSYLYGDCQKANLNENCVNPGEKKAFEINLSLIEEGLHRISVPICLNCKTGENFKESKRFYSNEFTIKEKREEAKSCNQYTGIMSMEEIEKCTCSEGYEKFRGLGHAYCATNSQKSCKSQTDCPNNEHCISEDGENWYCTGRYTGCYHPDPKNPESEICAD